MALSLGPGHLVPRKDGYFASKLDQVAEVVIQLSSCYAIW
uniref:Uncharacterized protein n=1 Tax=Arundo donax TaxID=35708 RepID=A0A0A8ZI15_ARUDO